ncbi:MAG TPA: phytanoyl-CoA dioxygenase family protein [Candidatus Limnocylindrales bacterium]|nr:phytanoyl-CoA dioxygenase family protein [Candidatus Limnocylindrales bacterium]
MQVLSNGVEVPTDSEHFAPMRDSSDLIGDPQALRGRFKQDGYVYLRGILDPQKDKGPASSRAHTDFDYMDRGSDGIITMWLPIGDCPVQSGGLTYLEGSHTKWAGDDGN